MPVLRGVDLDVPKGCLYGLIGPGAAGKSVLLKMISGLLKPGVGGGARRGAGRPRAHRARAREVPTQVRDAVPEQRALRLHDGGRQHRLPAPPALRSERGRDRRQGRRSGSESSLLPGFEERRMPSGLSGGQKKRVGVARATIAHARDRPSTTSAAGGGARPGDVATNLRAPPGTNSAPTGRRWSWSRGDLDRLLTVTNCPSHRHALQRAAHLRRHDGRSRGERQPLRPAVHPRAHRGAALKPRPISAPPSTPNGARVGSSPG